jgi:hypothetical protein
VPDLVRDLVSQILPVVAVDSESRCEHTRLVSSVLVLRREHVVAELGGSMTARSEFGRGAITPIIPAAGDANEGALGIRVPKYVPKSPDLR